MQVPEKFFQVEFGKAMAFGYRTEDVDEFVTMAIELVKSLQKENQELTEKLAVLAQSLEKYREDEESLRSALIGAQKLGDSILKDSRSKAEVILREATTNADHIVEEAHARLEREKADYDRLKAEVATFREGLFDLYKSHIDQISRLPHKEKQQIQAPAPKAPEPTPSAPVDEEEEPAPIPAPPPPKKAPAPEPIPLAVEPEEDEDYLPDPIPEPSVKRAPAKQQRPALRLELDYDEDEDEDDKLETDDEILSRFSSRTSGRRPVRPAASFPDDFEDEDDDQPLSRTIFSSKFGEMRFGEGFDLTQDDRGRTAGGRAGGRRR